MALENEAGNYYRITDVSVDPEGNFHCTLTVYRNKDARDNPGEFDGTKIERTGGTLSSEALDAAKAACYGALKANAPYSTYQDA